MYKMYHKNAKIHAQQQQHQQQQKFCACFFVRGFSTAKRSKLNPIRSGIRGPQVSR